MGPLHGIRVVEIAGLGPGPFAAMLLADMGADVVRVDRAGGSPLIDPKFDLLNRNKRSITVDLKKPDGVAVVLRLCKKADALVEGFRPGVMERLGIGPEACRSRNPRLVYGRVTGWGREGPLAKAAGHDINYIALSGALHMFGRRDGPPVPPVNLVGDFGGGGMLLALGIVCALLEAKTSGQGQVVDAAMVDGAALLSTMLYGMSAMGAWRDERGVNLIDGGAHFYDVYETADGKWISIGSLEPQFYAELIRITGLDREAFADQLDSTQWPRMKEQLTAVFKAKTRDEWCRLMEGSEVCFAPVLSMTEAAEHSHNAARHTFVRAAGVLQPAPAPRFERTPPELTRPPPEPGADTDGSLLDWGWSSEEIARLRSAGALG